MLSEYYALIMEHSSPFQWTLLFLMIVGFFLSLRKYEKATKTYRAKRDRHDELINSLMNCRMHAIDGLRYMEAGHELAVSTEQGKHYLDLGTNMYKHIVVDKIDSQCNKSKLIKQIVTDDIHGG